MTQTDDLVEFDEAIGRIEQYDPDTQRARIRIERGQLQVGDLIEIMGASDEPADVITINDLLVANDPVAQAPAGLVVEVRVPRPVSYLDDVFLSRPRESGSGSILVPPDPTPQASS